MSANHSMHAGSWTKLTLTELKDLCAACSFSVEGNKEELDERLHAYFDKRKDKGLKAQLKGSNRGQEPGPRNAYDRTGEVVDVDLDEDGGGEFEDDLDENSQEVDNRIIEEFAACFRGKEKVKSVPVDVFLTALSSIERKMDRNFSALYKEIEDGDGLDEAWPKVKLSRPRDHEYDFLAKIGKHLDKAIRVLLESNRKEIVGVCEEVESRAVTLRLAGWGTALQIVGSNDKMMEKYKDHIPLFSQAEQSSCSYEWGYRRKARKYQHKRKRASPTSSDSERDYYS
ncbi:6407_t:CDS:1 [Dentiscutata erythropus]|uniref:6407_t:CDS:1 n=1 Tax=Dentiscutata erythropus TaxID=1348616 RepID=A0A9N9N9X3_9GLOM|nr:6407_t:CDS:1 [Dentiscutata erythropus]